jgi:RNA polymerase sigma-70 factor (ECF subfamily)
LSELKKKANVAGERLLKGVPTALEEVIDLYQKKIYNLAFRFTGNQEEAFDLSQEIFLRLYSKIRLFSPKTDFNAWFMCLAVNTAINYRVKIRKNPAHIALKFFENKGISPDEKAGDRIDQEIRTQAITSLLTRLPKRERMVITLQIWDKKKVKDIAEIMNTTAKAVESLLTRARKRLKEAIKNEGFSF